MCSRWWPLLIIRSLPHVGDTARSKSKPLADQITPPALGAGLLWCFCPSAYLASARRYVFYSIRQPERTRRRLDGTLVCAALAGFTGDRLGATQQVSEIGFYLGAALALGLFCMSARSGWCATRPAGRQPGLCYGRLDLPADAQATRDCACAGRRPAHPVLAWHSPLQRCEQLAQALQALRPDLAPQPDVRLQELDFGTWKAWPGAPCPAPTSTPGPLTLPTPPATARTWPPWCSAWMRALQDARQQAVQRQCDVLWISHAGVARCVQWLLQPQQAPAPGP